MTNSPVNSADCIIHQDFSEELDSKNFTSKSEKIGSFTQS